MTEQELAEAVGLVARVRRCEHLAEKNRDVKAAHEADWLRGILASDYNIPLEPRGWRPPASIGPDVA